MTLKLQLDLKIDLARGCGFCFGVRNALKKAETALEEHGKIYLLGDIVHNERVVNDLSSRGAVVINDLKEARDYPLLFRAHGTEKHTVEEAEKLGLQTIDATCPLVTLIHNDVKELESEGRQVIIVGDKGHEEVMGIASQIKEPIIVSSPEDVDPLPKMKKAGLVTQSTQMLENVQEIISALVEKTHDLRVLNTICHPTTLNQTEVKRISRDNDVIIVIGSTTSANTKRLLSVSKKVNERSYMISGAEEIEASWFRKGDKVGITAGASTPDEVINEAVHYLKNL